MTHLRMARRRLLALGLPLALGALVPAGASAAVGDLSQSAGADGCVTVTGRSAVEPQTGPQDCTTATPGSLEAPFGAAVSPDGRHLYAVSGQVDDPNGSITADASLAVFDRRPDGRLVPRECFGANISQPAPPAPACALTGVVGLDAILRRATSVAVSPDGRSVYVAGTDGIGAFARNTVTGTLTPLTPACRTRSGGLGCAATRMGVGNVGGLVISPDGAQVYSQHGNVLSIFRRQPSGVLDQGLPQDCLMTGDDPKLSGICSPYPALTQGRSLVMTGDGANLYLASSQGDIAMIARRSDGTLASPGSRCLTEDDTSPNPNCTRTRGVQGTADIALSPDGAHAYLRSATALAPNAPGIALFKRNATGVLVRAGAFAQPQGFIARVRMAPDGAGLLVLGRDRVTNLARDPETGALTTGTCIAKPGIIADTCVDARAFEILADVAFDPAGASAYALSSFGQGQIAVLKRQAGPVPPPVGVPSIRPARTLVRAGGTAVLTASWTHPRRWRDLAAVLLRLSDDRGVLGTVQLDPATRTLRLVADDESTRGPSGRPGAQRVLTRRGLSVLLGRSALSTDGRAGKRVTLRLAVRPGPAAAGRTLRLELAAVDRTGRPQGFAGTATLTTTR